MRFWLGLKLIDVLYINHPRVMSDLIWIQTNKVLRVKRQKKSKFIHLVYLQPSAKIVFVETILLNRAGKFWRIELSFK